MVLAVEKRGERAIHLDLICAGTLETQRVSRRLGYSIYQGTGGKKLPEELGEKARAPEEVECVVPSVQSHPYPLCGIG